MLAQRNRKVVKIRLQKMLKVHCKDVESSLLLNHCIKGLDMSDLKKNIRFHIRETHPETNMTDEEMRYIDSQIEKEAEIERRILEEWSLL